jgi:hypothetical protein
MYSHVGLFAISPACYTEMYMALRPDVYGGRLRHPDMVTTFLYPWGGERHNNKEILSEVVALTGGVALGLQTPGTGRVFVSHSTLKRLRPGKLGGLAEDYAGDVKEYLDGLGIRTRVLAAQSGRVALGARMQLSSHRPFTHVLLRDGVNLRAPEKIGEGYQQLTHQRPAQFPTHDEPKSVWHKILDGRAQVRGLIEVFNQAQLLCSTESMDAVRGLAIDPTTPVLHITFEDGICGSPQQQQDFNSALLAIRAEHSDQSSAPLRAHMYPGAHGDLQNTFLLAEHIRDVVGLSAPQA